MYIPPPIKSDIPKGGAGLGKTFVKPIGAPKTAKVQQGLPRKQSMPRAKSYFSKGMTF